MRKSIAVAGLCAASHAGSLPSSTSEHGQADTNLTEKKAMKSTDNFVAYVKKNKKTWAGTKTVGANNTPSFVFSEEKMNWPDAQMACQKFGAHLASVRSKKDNKRLLEVTNKTKEPVWIGGNDLLKDGEWKWTDGTDLDLKETKKQRLE